MGVVFVPLGEEGTDIFSARDGGIAPQERLGNTDPMAPLRDESREEAPVFSAVAFSARVLLRKRWN